MPVTLMQPASTPLATRKQASGPRTRLRGLRRLFAEFAEAPGACWVPLCPDLAQEVERGLGHHGRNICLDL